MNNSKIDVRIPFLFSILGYADENKSYSGKLCGSIHVSWKSMEEVLPVLVLVSGENSSLRFQ